MTAPPDPVTSAFASAISAASFRVPIWRNHPTAWMAHGPFMFWLIDALKPSAFVELGTHYGYSFFAACQAVEAGAISTTCTAIDTWQGDEHAGQYGEEVYETVRRHVERFKSFATLKRSTFDEAVSDFENGSIDLLHIDGRHFYEDVRHDYETWAPKMSDRGVVLLHDTREFENGFGVHKFWKEIQRRYPSFEFFHCHGLGVLGVGRNLPLTLIRLFEAARDAAVAGEIRLAYARLGAAL